MTEIASASANAAEIEAWNGALGTRWLRQYEVTGEQLAPLGTRVMDHLAVSAGERVLDVGCGAGETTRELARRVGARGSVLGVDISGPLLAVARERSAGAGVKNVAFVQADAQSHRFEAGRFDGLFSRFGVMFFDDPQAAFTNLRTALRPGGRLAFVCWRTPGENLFITLPTRVGVAFLDPPPPRPDPLAPGPFAFADAARTVSLLEAAGFADVAAARFDDGFTGPYDKVRALMMGRDPLPQLLDDAAKRTKVEAAMNEALAPITRDGRVTLPAATWLVSARNP